MTTQSVSATTDAEDTSPIINDNSPKISPEGIDPTVLLKVRD